MRDDLFDLGERWFGFEMGLAHRKTFGCPSWYKSKKMFAFLYDDALGIKCDPDLVNEKVAEKPEVYGHFNPGDGVMKNWLMITRAEAREYDEDKPLVDKCFKAMT